MDTITLLCFCIAVSLATTGLYVSMHWPGMILHPLKLKLEGRIPAPFNKPLYDCLICMSSVYSSLCWLVVHHSLHWQLLWAILIVAGLNTLICLALENLSDHGC